MKAIITKYHGPTNTRGSRITASDEDGNHVTINVDCGSLTVEQEHTKAAVALCKKMQWPGTMMRGSLKSGYVFVFVDLNDCVVLHGTKQNYKIVLVEVMDEPMLDAFTLNSYECGCRIVSEHAGGLGAKTIAWCSVHKHAEFLLLATKRVHSAFVEGRNPTFDAVDKLTTAIAACEFKG